MAKKRNLLLPMAAALALISCGGGGGGGGGKDDVQNTDTATISGKAVDGYLSGATVFCDSNNNGAWDSSEMITTTDGNGNFRFSSLCSSSVVVESGRDTTTGLLFQGALKAKPGSSVVTPLTTLLTNSGLTKAQLAAALGLPEDTDIANLDPLASGNGELYARTLAVQQIVQQVANVFGMQAGADDLGKIYTYVATALAAAIQADPSAPLFTSANEVDLGLLEDVISEVQGNINDDPSLPNVSLTLTDIGLLRDTVATQAKAFLDVDATDRSALDTLAGNLQDPTKTPVVETEAVKTNYIFPENDEITINGNQESLDDFEGDGLTVDGLDSIGLAYGASVSNPAIDTVVDVAASLKSLSNQQMLQVKVERVRVQRDRNTGNVTLQSTDDTVVTVYVRSKQGSTFGKSYDETFSPLKIVNNAVVVDYADLVARTVGNPSNGSGFDVSQFTNITGTFEVKFVVSPNLNVRRGDATSSTALDTLNIGITNTIKGVTGPGIEGKLIIN